MARRMNIKQAVSFIEEKGALLVFPINNRPEPESLWSSFFPRSEMLWDWDSDGDDRVADLWRLREELSRSDRVVYTKWYRGRATFFSKNLFVAMMTLLKTPVSSAHLLSSEAALMLEILEIDSPQSTKALKKAADLQGKFYESRYTKALKELWSRLLIVGYGEVDDGAFPSLAMGASKNIFEDLYLKAKAAVEGFSASVTRTPAAQPAAGSSAYCAALKVVDKHMPHGCLFRKYFDEVLKKTQSIDDEVFVE